MRRFYKKAAFTLLEMLVVITIITLLATMILVSFNKFKAKAREMQCKNNLKDIHGCFAVNHADWLSSSAIINLSGYYKKYQSDNKYHWQKGWVDRIGMPDVRDNATDWDAVGTPTPWRGDDAYRAITNGTLYEASEPDLKIYLCPVFERIANTVDGSTETIHRSYVANGYINKKSYKSLASDGRGLSRYMMFADTAISNRTSGGVKIVDRACFKDGSLDASGGDGLLVSHQVTGGYPNETVGDYHSGGKANVIFMDGHIESIDQDVNTVSNLCTGLN